MVYSNTVEREREKDSEDWECGHCVVNLKLLFDQFEDGRRQNRRQHIK